MGILDSIKDTMACIMVHSRNFTRYQILTLHRTSNKGVATFHLLYTIVILRHLPGVGLGRQVDLKDNACLLSRGSCSFFCKAVDAKCFLLHKKQNGKRENQKWMKFDQTESQVFRLQSKTKVSMNFMFLSKPKSLTFKTEILERTRDVSCFVVSLEQIRGIKKTVAFSHLLGFRIVFVHFIMKLPIELRKKVIVEMSIDLSKKIIRWPKKQRKFSIRGRGREW